MFFLLRFGVYIAGGGAFFAAVDFPDGLPRWAAVLAYILAIAYVEHWVNAGRRPVSAIRQARRARPDPGKHPRRRLSRAVYATEDAADAGQLATLLRERGLHPMTVIRRAESEEAAAVHEVHLPGRETAAGRAIVARYSGRRPSSGA